MNIITGTYFCVAYPSHTFARVGFVSPVQAAQTNIPRLSEKLEGRGFTVIEYNEDADIWEGVWGEERVFGDKHCLVMPVGEEGNIPVFFEKEESMMGWNW